MYELEVFLHVVESRNCPVFIDSATILNPISILYVFYILHLGFLKMIKIPILSSWTKMSGTEPQCGVINFFCYGKCNQEIERTRMTQITSGWSEVSDQNLAIYNSSHLILRVGGS